MTSVKAAVRVHREIAEIGREAWDACAAPTGDPFVSYDFLSLGVDTLPSPRADLYRAKGMPVIAWTVRSAEEWDSVSDHCDNLIFEGFAA